ncbi:DUF4270 domain-containing protein [Lutibacter holmesii]|uniref:DUF4270 domain-containing protein n=1 Tax=Lutibacter holmesii TaxID=1137985 RepID=A0ABW3WMR2_9FLAO
MTTKVVTILKYVGLFSIVFFSFISCEKEIENIGVGIVDNGKFTIGDFVAEVGTNSENVERVPANGVPQYLLGSYSDNEFGALKGSIVSQILLSATGDNYDYGENAAIDSVLIYIPYQTTQLDDATDGKPLFEIDSVFGNADQEFELKVYELKTFLNTLDPTDPSKPMTYYSDKVFEKSSTPFYAEKFKVNPNDTVAYIKRYMPDGVTVFDTDTIKETNASPSIKLPLNEAMIQEIFVDNASGSGFESTDNFIRYFRGFYIEAVETTTKESHLISLSMASSRMVIYYSNDEDEDTDEDLDGDEITGEENVRVKHFYNFTFGSNKSNVLERDNSNIQESGPDRLYVQGAAGSVATIDLFEGQDLPELRENEYLITGATLTFYVDQDASSDIVPEQLFIYNYQDNEQILDMLTEGVATVGAALEYDDDGNPYKYVFTITDYVSEVLVLEDYDELVTLGIKVYNPTDLPSSTTNTTISEYSWTPKGVVLYNQSEEFGDKRVKLDIFYSQINN